MTSHFILLVFCSSNAAVLFLLHMLPLPFFLLDLVPAAIPTAVTMIRHHYSQTRVPLIIRGNLALVCISPLHGCGSNLQWSLQDRYFKRAQSWPMPSHPLNLA